MSKLYNPSDWYWQKQDGTLFSSARARLVSADDGAFAGWRADGAAPTAWPRDDAGQETDAALQAVLAPYGLSVSGAPHIPQSVSRAQAKIALHRAGLLDLVKTAVEADPEVLIWFDDALTWDRQNPHVVALGKQLLGDDAAVDALFVTAAQIAA